jgi:hypothetical protein
MTSTSNFGATYFDPVTEETVTRNEMESRAGIESLDHLNASITQLMVEFAPLANLFRGNGQAADSARKRHRSVIGRRIEMEREAKGEKPLAQDAVERWANADDEHRKFCDDLTMKGIRYEQLRAAKEALEARRESRIAELYYAGKEVGLAR